jgi:hypothetical protein
MGFNPGFKGLKYLVIELLDRVTEYCAVGRGRAG